MLKFYWSTSSIIWGPKCLSWWWNSLTFIPIVVIKIPIRLMETYWHILECLENYYHVKGSTFVFYNLNPLAQIVSKWRMLPRDALFTGAMKALGKQAWSAAFALKPSFTAMQTVPLFKWKLLINLALYSFAL